MSTIITKVSNALNTLVSREKPGFQALSKRQCLQCFDAVGWAAERASGL